MHEDKSVTAKSQSDSRDQRVVNRSQFKADAYDLGRQVVASLRQRGLKHNKSVRRRRWLRGVTSIIRDNMASATVKDKVVPGRQASVCLRVLQCAEPGWENYAVLRVAAVESGREVAGMDLCYVDAYWLPAMTSGAGSYGDDEQYAALWAKASIRELITGLNYEHEYEQICDEAVAAVGTWAEVAGRHGITVHEVSPGPRRPRLEIIWDAASSA